MALPVSFVRLSLLLLVALPFCAPHPGPGFHAPREFQRPALHSDRTYRRDPLNGFRKYPGGWNITEVHYFASVGYTAIPLFAIALVWFVFFFLVMLGICCHHCCCPHRTYKYSRTAYALSLILLILFTCAAIAGCVMLYVGQGKFHKSTATTLKFVVGEANYTVDNLRNLSDSLSAAKKIDIAQALLSSDVQSEINEIQGKLNSSATDLAIKTTDNAGKIKKLLNRVQLALIVIAAVMLLLAFIGFLLSIFGLEFLVSVLVVIGWILVTGTFILCGVFLLLHKNFPPVATPFYYNQSGPLMPLLCNPFTPDLNGNRTCTRGEVTLDNATQVWKSFECQATTASGSEVCTTVGRVTPSIYGQMAAAVNVSQGLYQYGPFLIQLEDCTFVRDTFTTINQDYCPGLQRYSKWVYVGLVIVSAAVMLSLIFWVIYARERRHRAYKKQFIAEHQPYPVEDRPVPTASNA
ncbi:hypothetical protein BAE44_0026002 [Dichanthelium oligosanthes]|uniref:Transmembrane protein n=1 Tax=Dichanthelium oligosanthes TaxID=888268 RepID=A0A1E5UJB5_9POAL|nr:hypothetical protein BAE44_0026002 [Dichanthelium oligosanthes]